MRVHMFRDEDGILSHSNVNERVACSLLGTFSWLPNQKTENELYRFLKMLPTSECARARFRPPLVWEQTSSNRCCFRALKNIAADPLEKECLPFTFSLRISLLLNLKNKAEIFDAWGPSSCAKCTIGNGRTYFAHISLSQSLKINTLGKGQKCSSNRPVIFTLLKGNFLINQLSKRTRA